MKSSVTQSRTTPVRLLLVDDHEVVRLGLRTLFNREPTIQVVGEASTMREAIQEAARLNPDVILMDIRLPDGSGVEACREIREVCPSARVLFLTSYSDDDTVLSTLFSGASGYLLKEVGGEAMVNAVWAASRGESTFDQAVMRRMRANLHRKSTQSPGQATDLLSHQEKRVLALVAEGKTNKEIGAELSLSDKTVKNYLSTVFQKLQVSRRAQAAAIYTQRAHHKQAGP